MYDNCCPFPSDERRFGAVPARRGGSPGIFTLGHRCCGKAGKLPGAETMGADSVCVVTLSCATRQWTGMGVGWLQLARPSRGSRRDEMPRIQFQTSTFLLLNLSQQRSEARA